MYNPQSSINKRKAICNGEDRYEGIVHTKCGTKIKYVKNHSCVHCTQEQNQITEAVKRAKRQSKNVTNY